MDDIYYIPEWERPSIQDIVRMTAFEGMIRHGGELPNFVVVISIIDDKEEILDFILMGDPAIRELYYESLKPVETNGVREYMRVYAKDCT